MSTFEFLSFVTIQVLEFWHNLSFEFLSVVTIWVFKFCHNLSFWVLSHFEFLSCKILSFWVLSYFDIFGENCFSVFLYIFCWFFEAFFLLLLLLLSLTDSLRLCLFLPLSQPSILHPPKLFPWSCHFQNCLLSLCSSFPSGGGKFLALQ